MSKFTKAPWIIDNDGDGIYSDTEEYQVAYISYINYNKNKEMQANARLIAAAPEMYYLLKELTEKLSAYGDDVREDLYSLMIEAERLLERIDGEEAQA